MLVTAGSYLAISTQVIKPKKCIGLAARMVGWFSVYQCFLNCTDYVTSNYGMVCAQ
jgi:hypothetical protein